MNQNERVPWWKDPEEPRIGSDERKRRMRNNAQTYEERTKRLEKEAIQYEEFQAFLDEAFAYLDSIGFFDEN
jgi:hypothetical protein